MRSSSYRSVTAAALIVAVVGIIVQILSGVDYPTVPPGGVILVVAAGIVAFAPWRWTPFVGVAVGVFMIFGFVISGATANLATDDIGVLVGSWIQFLAVIVATVAGLIAVTANYQTTSVQR